MEGCLWDTFLAGYRFVRPFFWVVGVRVPYCSGMNHCLTVGELCLLLSVFGVEERAACASHAASSAILGTLGFADETIISFLL